MKLKRLIDCSEIIQQGFEILTLMSAKSLQIKSHFSFCVLLVVIFTFNRMSKRLKINFRRVLQTRSKDCYRVLLYFSHPRARSIKVCCNSQINKTNGICKFQQDLALKLAPLVKFPTNPAKNRCF